MMYARKEGSAHGREYERERGIGRKKLRNVVL
jgi:hypothetical protein